jgi:hypothetical protein
VERLLTRKIRDIRPGQRVLADNPELQGIQPPPFDINPADWRLLSFQMDKPDGSVLETELPRPLSWMKEVNAGVGNTVEQAGRWYLSIPCSPFPIGGVRRR